MKQHHDRESTAPKGGRGFVLPRLTGFGRVWVLNGVLALATGILYLAFGHGLDRFDTGFRIEGWVLAGMFFLTEVYVVHVQFRRDSESFSLNEIPLVLGLFFSSPGELVAAQIVGAGLALFLRRRQSILKLTFNISHLALETVTASLVFHAIATPDSLLGVREIAGTYVATFLTITMGVVAVVAAISLAEEGFQGRMFSRVLGLGTIGAATNSSMALLGVATLRANPNLAWLLLVPGATLFFAYRAYTSERQRHRSLEQLYESTRSLQRSTEFEATMHALLSRARAMFRAEVAVITLFPAASGEPGLRSTLGADDQFEAMQPVPLDPRVGVWARVAAERQALVLPRPIRNEQLRAHFESRGLKDAMVAPLYGEDEVVGTLLVGNRLGDVSTFDAEDLRMFETLSNHASTSLQNARLVSRLQESLARLTELNRMKDDFIATVSHELRTPLTSIQGFVKTLLRPDARYDPAEQRTFLEIVDRQSERLHGLIEDLLIVSRIESHQILPIARVVSLPELSRQVVESFLVRARGHSFKLRFDIGFPSVTTDEETLHRILLNLVENAVKYSPEGTRITIRGTTEDDGVVLSVEDEGFGIPDEAQEQIFERFYQVDQSSTRKVGGTGLGLYICRRLAERIGGRVWLARSEPGNGSTFSLWIPKSTPPGGFQLPEAGTVVAPRAEPAVPYDPKAAVPTDGQSRN